MLGKTYILQETEMKKDVAIALGVFILLFFISWIMSITLGLGKAESVHDPSSLWLYGRRIIMVILAVAIPWLTKREGISILGWKVSFQWILISCGVGVGIGFGNPGGFDPTLPFAIVLAIFHTFATELFFRGYLFRTFARSFQRQWMAVILSSFLYGLSYLTVGTASTMQLVGKILFVCLFTTLGIIFSYSYKKSGSFLVPWIMHFFGVLKYRSLF
jgi:membrane protease YdiL (CAAX protease family)